MRWGWAVPWDKSPLINAKSETVTTLATFKPHLDNRFLLLADGFHEKGVCSGIPTSCRCFKLDCKSFKAGCGGDWPEKMKPLSPKTSPSANYAKEPVARKVC
jgi:hypothetical protein